MLITPHFLSAHCNEKIASSMAYLEGELSPYLSKKSSLCLVNVHNSISKSDNILFSYYLLHTFLIDNIKFNQLNKIDACLPKWFFPNSRVINYKKEGENFFWDTFDRIVCFENKYNVKNAKSVDNKEFKNLVQKIEKAKNIIKLADSSVIEEIKFLCPAVIFVDSDIIESGSSSQALGMCFFNSHLTVTQLIERLIHELTHNYIFCLSTIDFLCEDGEKIISPIRKTLRSREGVYHATIVLFRIINIFKIILKKTGLDIEYQYMENFIKQYEENALIAYDELLKKVKMSETAKYYLKAMQKKISVTKIFC